MSNNMIIITPEEVINKEANKIGAKSVFLAGTIDNGNSLNWQDKTIIELINLGVKDLEVYNPRREHWNPNPSKEDMEYQIKWEQDHLDKANIIAENVVTQFGLVGEGLTERVYSSKNIAFTTDEIRNRIDNQIIKVLSDAKKYAEKLLDEHKAELEIIVNALMEKGIINQKEIDELLKDYPTKV